MHTPARMGDQTDRHFDAIAMCRRDSSALLIQLLGEAFESVRFELHKKRNDVLTLERRPTSTRRLAFLDREPVAWSGPSQKQAFVSYATGLIWISQAQS